MCALVGVAKTEIKFGAQLAAKIEPGEMEKFIANAEACKSTKDIVLRELVYAFNRYCEGGRFPVLQRLEIASPGYMISEDGQSVYDAGRAANVRKEVAETPRAGSPRGGHSASPLEIAKDLAGHQQRKSKGASPKVSPIVSTGKHS